MAGCEHCGGDCTHCVGCGASYVLSPEEIAFLRLLGEYAFLPVARKADDLTPIYCGEGDATQCSDILRCLDKKNLIDLDFYTPLKGFVGYGNYPLRGSCALTLQGQQVLEVLEIQGTQ